MHPCAIHCYPTSCSLFLRNAHLYTLWWICLPSLAAAPTFTHLHTLLSLFHPCVLLHSALTCCTLLLLSPLFGGHWFTPLFSDLLFSPAPKSLQLHSLVHHVHTFTLLQASAPSFFDMCSCKLSGASTYPVSLCSDLLLRIILIYTLVHHVHFSAPLRPLITSTWLLLQHLFIHTLWSIHGHYSAPTSCALLLQ
jgi:hypothetical protein